ncbi:hypothetical protein KXD93_20610 [Mucilaginibacter sp. BJC16-A38]|uniref:hypothetical protein n=1 Tax=Mucilaginibacter phenanthrenivorans TaxID=1234842 RepID=UPI002157FED6|nr:hypothetical protein [Mucilaginibacter phenanthrenivorans]MCR8560065.1 hypothetical protein [Mucilaginibacter phenanthrenivorans]
MIKAEPKRMPLKDNTKYWLACIVMLLIAMVQCYRTIHDLHWASEPDFDRDIAYIRATLNGNYGKDPNIAGQYMWYNPMLFLMETLIVKVTGLPINIVVARAGAFINLLSPVAFFFMAVKLFDFKVGLAALLSFLFLVNGNLPCWGGATYSPWLISDTFSQFLFYTSIFFCYKAFAEQKLFWFIILGASLGLTFLGHSAPVFIIILIMISIQGQRVIKALRSKEYPAIGKLFFQGLVTIIPFVIFAFPFLYYVYGKYHFHFINHAILECAPGVFARKETLTLLKLNITFSLPISVIGLVWFYRKFENQTLRKIVWNWFFICLIMYVYESAVPTADHILHIKLPDTIPAFHYFFYLKALQSVFFGFGFIFLLSKLVQWINSLNKKNFTLKFSNNLVIICVLLYAFLYYPIYSKRADFVELREEAIKKANEKDKIEVYNFITTSIPLDNVLLCEHDLSLFPVMPSAIKMVSVETYFSNPYISYDQRESDRNTMLNYLSASVPASAAKLFNDYNVSIVLLTNQDYAKFKTPAFANVKVIFKNGSFTMLSFGKNSDMLTDNL